MAWTFNGDISHTRPDGRSCFTVIDDLGIASYARAENIAAGYKSAESVSVGWKNSEGHYHNMIGSNYTRLGVGVAYLDGVYYWTQIFSS